MESLVEIIVQAPPQFVDVVVITPQIYVDVILPLSQNYFQHRYTTLSAWVAPVNYIGRAVFGSLQNAAVWRITKIETAVDGSVTTKIALSVKWTDRLTETYI